MNINAYSHDNKVEIGYNNNDFEKQLRVLYNCRNCIQLYTTVEQYMYNVIRLRQWGTARWWLWHNTSPKMLARNCKRCMVRFYLILVRYWMCICGHTFTTSDQVSSLSINHTRVLASMAHVCDLLLQWCHPWMLMFHVSGARTFLSVAILPLHMNFLLCFFFQKGCVHIDTN